MAAEIEEGLLFITIAMYNQNGAAGGEEDKIEDNQRKI